MQYFLRSPTLAAAASLLVAGGDFAAASSVSASAPAPTGATYESGFDITTNWANLSPYRDANGFNVPKGVPRGCELSQAHILHRHAQRYPTDSDLDGAGIDKFSQKVRNYSAAHPKSSVGTGPLAFLDNWESLLGEDLLLVSGAATEATAGADAWAKYGRLLYRAGAATPAWDKSLNVYPNGTARPKPVFRTTSQARILESARWWLSGFFGNSGADNSDSKYDLVVIPEVESFNNTLAAEKSCPGDSKEGYQGDNTAEQYIPEYTKVAKSRLARFLPADFNLTSSDVLAMQNLCPYETATLGNSAFCSLFTEQEWRDFEYNLDIQYYGDYGFGSSIGRAQGIGYILELASRLQGKLITSSDTSINYTFDNNEAQFPLHQPLYMDMSHDSNIVAVLAALGLKYFNYGPHGLPPLPHAPARTFTLNQVTPFGARLVSEIWKCPSTSSLAHLDPVLYQNPDLSSNPSKNTTDHIRFVLNGAPVPLDGVVGCQESAVNGFCTVENFLKGVPKLKSLANYQFACFGKHDARGGKQVADGRPE